MTDPHPTDLRWNARSLLGVYAVAVGLLAWSWSRIEGYPLADAVEYMDRARSLVAGEGLGAAAAVRSFAFSLVFVPVFAVFDVLGLEDAGAAVWVARLVQVGFALGLVQSVAQLAARLFGRPAGIAAAWLVAANPYWMLYGVSPIADVAAGFCVARALLHLLPRPGEEDARALRGGLWLGAALLVSYKTFPIALGLFALLFVRDRPRGLRTLGLGLAGLGAGAAVQVVLDKWAYGTWGVSLGRYLVENVGGVLGRVALELKLDRLAVAIYELQHDLRGWEGEYSVSGTPPAVRQRMPPDYYLTHLPELLVVPVLVVGALALVRFARRPRQDVAVLAGALVLNVAILSSKGSKSFRLWLPLLPLVVPLCAWGWDAVWSGAGRRGLRHAAGALLLFAALALGVFQRAGMKSAVHGGYWRAADAARAAAPDGGRLRFASGYPWATFQRGGAELEWTRFSFPLESWAGLDEDARARVVAELEALDAFAVHLPLLTEHPELFARVNARFTVAAAFYDQELHASLGPVFLLERAADAADGRRFFRLDEASAARSAQALRGLPHSTRFAAGGEELVLLGWEYETLPADGPDRHGWITYVWTSPTGLSADHRLLDRVTAPDERNAWQNNHDPAYGVHPTSTWPPGAILRESYLFVPGAEAMFDDRPHRPLGGSYRRGDRVPLRVWMMVCAPDGEAELRPSLAALPPTARDGGAAPRDQALLRRTPGGYAFSADGLVEVGRFHAPVAPRARVPDDGRPVPD